MAGLLCRRDAVSDWRAGQPHYDQARQDKSQEAHQQPLPMIAREKIETGQGQARSEQQASEEPKGRPSG
jgi:hypothetical protein